ncbi:DUF4012 domain-containing protein [Actinoplanes sp. NPDC049548]|uniref:DUF4012 domain-containing protein n=1 Tax=Actinoplanes sp. NPDC049548 TaxID=3155152 RepID=UPI00341C0586
MCATAVLSVAGAGTAWVGVRGTTARDHLLRASALVQQLRQQLEDVNPSSPRTLAALQRETRAARAEVDDPAWRIAVRAPGVGDELTAVRTVAAAMDDLAHDGLPPLVETAGVVGVGLLVPEGGRIDLAPLQHAAPQVAAADVAMRRARDRVAAIDQDGLIAPVRTAVADLVADLDRAADTVEVAARSAALLPPMLGVDGARTYLMLFQNSAEVRATGGMPGVYVVIRADHGRLTIADQGTAAADIRTFKRPVLDLSATDRALYSDRLGTYPADVNLTPNFATAAELAREMYRRRSGRTVDGVLATDPVALSYLLGAIGPVPVPGGTALTARNAVPVLLSENYAEDISAEKQDQYFAAAAEAVFQAVVQRSLDPAKVLAALARAAGERRLLVWSSRPAENELLDGTVLTGVMPLTDGARPTVGVFLNDGSGAKLGYYLTQKAELSVVAGCRGDGRRELKLRVTLGSKAPRSGLPPYVLGLGLAGDPYTIRTMVSVYSSTGGAIADMRLNGAEQHFSTGLDRRRSVGIVNVDLPPGASRTLDVTLLTGVPADGDGDVVTPDLWTTPGVNKWARSVRSADGCPQSR